MPTIEFTPHLKRHLDCPDGQASGETLADALEHVFRNHPRLRGYLLDDQGAIRQHVAIFVDNRLVRDRSRLDIALRSDSKIHVMQALSGG